MQRVKVKITTRAKRNQIIGWEKDVLKIKLSASPVKNKANEALIDYLAKRWNTSKSNIRIIRGLKSKNKTLEILENVLFD